MSGLAEFLLARIAEEVAVAQAATQGRWFREKPSGDDFEQGAEWVRATDELWYQCEYYCRWGDGASDVNRGPQATPGHEHLGSDMVIGSYGHDADGVLIGVEDEAQILQWQPNRVLAECEAKRAIVALHPEAVSDELRRGAAWAYDEVLRRLALPYAEHPDFREEWRP